MNFILIKALVEHEIVVQNLMQYYIYDFSEYIKYDVEENGLFAPYPNLNNYWEGNNNKFPYVIKMDDKYVGFVLVKLINLNARSYFSIAEFFIMKKYRREGLGKAIAVKVFNLHKGQWEVYQRDSNKPAQIFWNKVINEDSLRNVRKMENGYKILKTNKKGGMLPQPTRVLPISRNFLRL